MRSARRHRTAIENTLCSHRLCSPSSAKTYGQSSIHGFFISLCNKDIKARFSTVRSARRHRTAIENTSCSHRLCSPSSAKTYGQSSIHGYFILCRQNIQARSSTAQSDRRHRAAIEKTAYSHRLCSPSSALQRRLNS